MRALVVDESSLQRRFVSWLLREFKGLEVLEAADATTALNLLLTKPVELLILEVKMAGMDGLTLLQKVRDNPGPSQHCDAMVVSVLSDEATKSRAQALRVSHFLTKPVPAVKLRDAVASKLRGVEGPQPGGSELRQNDRLRTRATVVFDQEAPSEAFTSDVSAFGAFIISSTLRPVGSTGRLKLHLPHLSEPIETEFRVIHQRTQALEDMPVGYGVRFLTDSPEALTKLVKAFESPGR